MITTTRILPDQDASEVVFVFNPQLVVWAQPFPKDINITVLYFGGEPVVLVKETFDSIKDKLR